VVYCVPRRTVRFCLVGAIAAGISATAYRIQPRPELWRTVARAVFTVAARCWCSSMVTMDLIGGHWLYHEGAGIHAPTLFTTIYNTADVYRQGRWACCLLSCSSLVHMRVAAVVTCGKRIA